MQKSLFSIVSRGSVYVNGKISEDDIFKVDQISKDIVYSKTSIPFYSERLHFEIDGGQKFQEIIGMNTIILIAVWKITILNFNY